MTFFPPPPPMCVPRGRPHSRKPLQEAPTELAVPVPADAEAPAAAPANVGVMHLHSSMWASPASFSCSLVASGVRTWP